MQKEILRHSVAKFKITLAAYCRIFTRVFKVRCDLKDDTQKELSHYIANVR